MIQKHIDLLDNRNLTNFDLVYIMFLLLLCICIQPLKFYKCFGLFDLDIRDLSMQLLNQNLLGILNLQDKLRYY